MRRIAATIFTTIACAMAFACAAVTSADAAAPAQGVNDPSRCEPTPAGQDYSTVNFHSECPNYKGWGTLSADPADSCIWSTGCAIGPSASPIDVYYWNGTKWVRHQMMNGQRAYAYPFTSGWSWAYMNGYWYAVRSDHLRV